MSDHLSAVRFRPAIASMSPYRQGRQAAPDGFKLSSNENPFPPLPSVVAAMEATLESINRYPDGSCHELKVRLADHYAVDTESIVVGPGSISVLEQLTVAVAGDGDEVLYSWRSFEGYPTVVTLAGATSVTVPNRPDGGHDLDAMLAAITPRTRAVFLCTPNNPTGVILTTAEVERFLAQVPDDVLVVLDEAYVDFVTDPQAVDGLTLLADYPNLVTLRTFSKAYGLAGLRIGFAIGAPELIEKAGVAGLPMSVSNIAQRAAIASLDAHDELRERVEHVVDVRNRIMAGLTDQGWELRESHGNFVWMPLGELSPTAGDIFADHGVIVRTYGDDGLRITVGEDESVEPLLSAAAEVVALVTK